MRLTTTKRLSVVKASHHVFIIYSVICQYLRQDLHKIYVKYWASNEPCDKIRINIAIINRSIHISINTDCVSKKKYF